MIGPQNDPQSCKVCEKRTGPTPVFSVTDQGNNPDRLAADSTEHAKMLLWMVPPECLTVEHLENVASLSGSGLPDEPVGRQSLKLANLDHFGHVGGLELGNKTGGSQPSMLFTFRCSDNRG